MEKKIILTGTPKAIENIVRENQNREKRGEISFGEYPPLEQELADREAALADRETALSNREAMIDKYEADMAEKEAAKPKEKANGKESC